MRLNLFYIGMFLILLGMIALTIAIPLLKRHDVTWWTFFAAGPLVLIEPSKYFRSRWFRLPSIVAAGTIFLWILVWIVTWFRDN